MPSIDRAITRCLKIAPEERKYSQFEVEQSKILHEIMSKTNTKIEVTATKDGSLSFCIFGKEHQINAAINLILNDFQTPVTLTVSVPKSIHGRLLGPKGARLSSIQDETSTKINMPRKEEDSDVIRVVGLKSNAERAVAAIQKYAKEFAGKTFERLSFERNYLLFVTGPFNENIKRWESMGIKIFQFGGLLPNTNNSNTNHNNSNLHNQNNNTNANSSNNSNHVTSTTNNHKDSVAPRNSDEIAFTLSGETDVVNLVKSEMLQIYDEKKKKCATVNIEVKKAQHKYILGTGGQNLRNLFAKTGVSVELPTENESETITLRGEQSKLGPALSELYSQAHSEVDIFFDAESWMHKYLVGQKKTNNIDFKTRGVDVKSYDDKIKLHGSPIEVEAIRDILESELSAIKKNIVRKDIRIEPRIHGYIIGKQGATVEQIREESGAFILVPKADENLSELITLEGTVEAVTIAHEKIEAIAKKYEASKKLVIDQQLHGSIIGKGGEKIRGIRGKFSQIVFTFPEPGSKSNEVTLVGPTDEVEACYNYLSEFHKQLQENNYQAQVPIRADVVKYLPDAQPAIKRLKLEHKVKIDIFIGNNDSVPASQGASKVDKKSNNDTSLSNETQQTTDVDGGPNSKSSKGGKNAKLVKKQQQQTNAKIANATKNNNTNINVNNIINNNDDSESYAIIIGKKEDVEIVKAKLPKLFDELSTTVEHELKMPHKLHQFLNPRGKLCRQLMEDFQNRIVISIVMPDKKSKQQHPHSGSDESNGKTVVANGVSSTKEPNNNSNSNNNNNNNKENNVSKDQQIDIVKIRGPKGIAKKAEKKFEALIAECQEKLDKNYQAQVSVPQSILKKFIFTDKSKINKMKETHSVKIILPDKKNTSVQIVGYEKNVQAALQQFNKLVKDIEGRVEQKIEIASQLHPRLIGAGGRVVKKLMDEHKVEVKFARQDDQNPNFVTIFGKAANVEAAKNQMLKQSQQYMSYINKSEQQSQLQSQSQSQLQTQSPPLPQQSAPKIPVCNE